MNWLVAIPEIILSVLSMLILVYGVLRKPDQTQACTMLTLGAFVLTGFLLVTRAGGIGYYGQFIVDPFAVFCKVLILLGAALTLMLALDYNYEQRIERFEYPVLMIFAVVGMMGMVSATNLMTLYLSLELQSLALYVMAAFARDELRSSEAGLKYFVLGALASGLILYGISLVYGFSGTMDFHVLRQALTSRATVSVGTVVGVVFVIAGLAFKTSLAPFHMWTPDVYEGAPSSVTAFLATAPKVAALGLFLRTMVQPFGHLVPSWQLVLEIISICSMILGALAAIGQFNIKRLMAYSSIGHMGYALIGLVVGTEAGVRGALVYLLTYIFMSAGTWACIIAMRRRGLGLEKIEDLSGLASTDPALALAFAIFMFSMAGIPPLAGLFGKLYVFLAAVQAHMWTLVVIGVLSSVVASYYYMRIVKVMYFDAPAPAFDRKPAATAFVGTVSGLFTLLFFLFAGPLVASAGSAAASLFG
jgi:NADH-quinone oxidoreductase subunit N